MIKTLIRAMALGTLVLTAVVALLMAAAWTSLPLDRVALHLRGETFSLADLQGTRAVLFFVLAVAAVVVAIIAALVLTAFAVGLGALGIALGLIATVGSLALAVAPFVLAGWLLWRLVHPRPAVAVVRP